MSYLLDQDSPALPSSDGTPGDDTGTPEPSDTDNTDFGVGAPVHTETRGRISPHDTEYEQVLVQLEQ